MLLREWGEASSAEASVYFSFSMQLPERARPQGKRLLSMVEDLHVNPQLLRMTFPVTFTPRFINRSTKLPRFVPEIFLSEEAGLAREEFLVIILYYRLKYSNY